MRDREGKPLVRLGAGVMILSPEDKLLIVQQENESRVTWGPVGGSLDFGETIEDCAVREAYEECGLRVRVQRVLSIDEFWHAGVFRGVGIVFLAEPEPWPQEVCIPEWDGETRFLDYRWVSRGEVQDYLPDNQWEFWTQFWPTDVTVVLTRRLDFDN